MDATNPYQPADLDAGHRRRSLVIIVSAAFGSILALIVLNTVARPSRSDRPFQIRSPPAAPLDTLGKTTRVVHLSAAALGPAQSP